MTIVYFRQIFVVMQREKLISIYFRDRYTTTSRRVASPQPPNNDAFAHLNAIFGQTGALVNCPEGGNRRKGRCLPQRQIKTVDIFVFFTFIYSF